MERRGEKRKLPKGMEFQITTPTTITARRIPRRKARETPSSNAPDLPATTSKLSASKPLSHEDIREPEPEPEPNLSLSKPSDDDAHQDLSVFLGIRPLDLKPRPKKKSPNGGGPKSKAELEKDKLKKKKKIPDKQAICLVANDSPSVTLTVPPSLNESKRKKGEIYDGFSHGFTADSLQGCSEIGGKCGKGVFETLGNAGNVNEEQLQELDQQQDSKALWNVLKQYKKELEVSKNEVQSLQEKLRNEKVRVLDMEKQLNKFKSSCSCLARSSRKMSSNSELLLGSQELPASDVERSNRCQALCSNGGKKHLNVEKARSKLLPVSTMLVNEVGAFDMEDDNPKGVNNTQWGAGGNNPQVQGYISADGGAIINLGIQVHLGPESDVNFGLRVGGGSNVNFGLKAGGRGNVNLVLQAAGGSNVNLETHYYDGTRSCPVSSQAPHRSPFAEQDQPCYPSRPNGPHGARAPSQGLGSGWVDIFSVD